MTKIHTDLAYKNGTAWAVIDKNDKVLKIIPMDSSVDKPRKFHSAHSAEVLKLADRKRYCAKTRAVADELNKQIFLKFRTESRNELSKLGAVISGYTARGTFEFHEDGLGL